MRNQVSESSAKVSQLSGTGPFLPSAHISDGSRKKEYLLPEMIDCLIKEGKAKVDVLETKDTWFGVTYQEDKAAVTEAFANLVKSGVYPSNLYK